MSSPTMFGGISIGWEVERQTPLLRLDVDAGCVGTGYMTPADARKMAAALIAAADNCERLEIAAWRAGCRCSFSDRGVIECFCGGEVCGPFIPQQETAHV